jgi:hypothetical protein
MTSAIRFRVAAGFGMVLLALMMVMFVFGGVAFPAQIGNVGEIQMSAKTMNTKQFALAGAGKSSPDQGGGPLAGEANVGKMVAASGVVMEKSFDLDKVVPGAGDYRIKLAMGGPVEGEELVLGTRKICAGQSTMKQLQVNTEGGPAGLNLSAGDGTLNDARLAVVRLSASSISSQSLNIDLGKGQVDPGLFPGCLASP